MASGQRLLSDLLGITNVATQSLSVTRVENQIGSNGYGSIVNDKERKEDYRVNSEAPKSVDEENQVTFDPFNDGNKSMSVSDAFDESRSTDVKVPVKLLREINQNASVSSRDVSSNDSSERLPTPEATDLLKYGVFVSSSDLQMDASAPQTLADNKKHQNDRGNLQEYTVKVSGGLKQGTEKLNAKQDTPEQAEKEILVLQFPQGQKKTVLQEKFKNRMQNSAPVKKAVLPKIVASERSGNQYPLRDTKFESHPPTKSEGAAMQPTSANDAVSFAAIATSTALTPFLQIQNALESTISNLVNTMGMAHEAQDKFKSRLQEKRYEELESKIIEILDKRFANSGKEEHRVIQRNQEDKDKMTSIQGPIPTSYVAPISQPPFVAQPLFKASYPTYDSELQMIPTRDVGNSKKTSSPILPTGIHPGFPVSLLPQPVQKEPAYIPRSRPVPAKIFDKSTSPDSDIMHLKNAKTQTSSSDSSLLSDKSLLETPLPRSKIPVPFSRNTPKSAALRKQKAKRSSEHRNELLKRILKEDRHAKVIDKENAKPTVSSNCLKREDTSPTLVNAGDHRMKDQKENDGLLYGDKPMKKTKLGKDSQMSPVELIEEYRNVPAPIDRYLVYPLRDENQRLKDQPLILKDPPDAKRGPATGTRDGKSTTEGHHIAVNKVLSEVQQRRERLESNLGALIRRRDQQRLYELIDRPESESANDLQRIRYEVSKKIDEISTQIKETNEPKIPAIHAASTEEKQKKNIHRSKQRSVTVGTKQKAKDSSQVKSSKSRKLPEQKDKPKRKAVVKSEPTNAQAVVKPPFYDADLLAAVLGERVYQAHRSTVRPPHIQFHSPAKPPTGTNGLGVKPQVSREHEASRKATKQIGEIDDTEKDTSKPKYYFQPTEPDFYNIERFQYPSSGELVPVARSLGKPRQDEKLRLPIPSEDARLPVSSTPVAQRLVSQSNVAVIEINDATSPKDIEDKKKQTKLVIQNLPNIVIENTQDTLENEGASREVADSTVITTPPKPEEYTDFQSYIACTDVTDNEANDKESQEKEKALHFEGSVKDEQREYNEPRFPPERPYCETNSKGVEIQYKTTLEDKAQEWIEHELLARIVSQMNLPEDPTAIQQYHDYESEELSASEEEEEEEADWIQEILGPGGLQLLIDAGIPLNKELLEDLVKDVVAEKIASLLGYPKAAKTPARKSIIEEELVSDVLPNVLTPLATPDYTPVQSEAAEVHTPMLSSFTEDSSRDDLSALDEEVKEDTVIQKDDSSLPAENFVKISTPPKTPPVSESLVEQNLNVETPVSSLREDPVPTSVPDVQTPELSKAELTPPALGDFESTQSLTDDIQNEEGSSLSQEQSQHAPSPRILPPPPQIVQVITKPVSVQNSSFTVSSSTAVGTSMFDGISEGERLWSDDVIPGLYSDGEFPLSEGQALDFLLEEGDGDAGTNFKDLLQNLIGRKQDHVDDSATLKDTEDLNEDTLEEVSISEGEFLANDDYNDPMVKLLNQIRSPSNGGSPKDRLASEGEVSRGEDMEGINQDPVLVRGEAMLPTQGLRKRVLSAGEMAASNSNISHPQSYSIGEVRNLPFNNGNSPSTNEMPNRFRKDMPDNEAIRRTNSQGLVADTQRAMRNFDTSEELKSVDRSPEIEGNQHEQSEDAENGLERPRTILVQSGNFDTMSSFNFTDSLNEQRLDSFNGQGTVGEAEERSPDANQPAKEVRDFVDMSTKNQVDNRPPTKITLTIPSVADEDSSDELTLEGDDIYSHDDVSNISL
ncbi:protein TALPID3-like isoform X3 [Rhopilema esculentum]|uniref:protein TALPID3-like isoform X3 n=1 Tax=Rhopilema esculentum TaxID=499914 RepID=UPI0031E3A6D1